MAFPMVLALALAIGACSPERAPEQKFSGTDITGVPWGGGFKLTDHNGQTRSLADFKGKVTLLFFGYTNCPGPCPTALAEMAQLIKELGTDGAGVQVLFVTVDPERDTPQRLATYLQSFHPSFLGLTGPKEELEKAAKEFKIHYQAQKQQQDGHSGHGAHGGYMVDHSTGIYMLDRSGRARLYFSANGRSVAAMVHDVKLLLAE
ncbi:MAG: SCO family protein [Betaproteobacteria bacterium]